MKFGCFKKLGKPVGLIWPADQAGKKWSVNSSDSEKNILELCRTWRVRYYIYDEG